MKSNKKTTIGMILLIIVMAVLFAIPGFAETYEELKEKFVTREEWDEWVNGKAGSTGISQVISSLEVEGQIKVQSKTKYEMSVRGIKLPGAD